LVIQILLWPVQRLLDVLFPPHKFDGLSPAVTSQAAEEFSAYLLGLVPSVSELPWAPLGFLACKNEAIQNNALLLIYLHSPLHREAATVARKFCRDEIVSQLLNPHLVALGVGIHSAQGEQLAQLLGATAYPLLAVLQPTRGSNAMELILKVQGPALVELSVGSLMGLLQGSLHRHEHMLAEVEVRRLQRQQESELRAEQDAEYQAALQADQERQRVQEQERQRLARERDEQEAALLQEQSQRECRLQKARAILQPEPTDNVAQIRFVLPSGKKVIRKFGADERLSVLRAFLTLYFHDNSMAEMPNIGLSTAFPKKCYDEESDELLTLRDAGLFPQAVLMVQDLDA
jgi:FAS-associated factor 2